MKKYLFFASLAYCYPILRPLQDEIRRRGDQVAWFLEPSCENLLEEGELQLKTINEVMEYNPLAVFSPVVYVYDFFPGVKVMVFHGYALNKRAFKIDNHFRIRGWFDIYCTQGPSTTPAFKELETEYGSFKVYETGWCRVDPFFTASASKIKRNKPTIFYASTFTKGITSVYDLYDTIEELIKTKPWDWIITLHPKQDDQEIIRKYAELGERFDNVTFMRNHDGLETFRQIDVMLCDSSSIIIEVELLDKPVVTYRNTMPGPHLLNVLDRDEVGPAIEKALTRPPELMQAIYEYTMYHEAHRDGHNSARVLDAVDDFVLNYKGHLKKKKPGFIRKWKLRRQSGYFRYLFNKN